MPFSIPIAASRPRVSGLSFARLLLDDVGDFLLEAEVVGVIDGLGVAGEDELP